MRTSLPLSLLVSATFLANVCAAQGIPGEIPGDTALLNTGGLGTYVTVRAEDGHAWLQQNMGSTEVAISSGSNASYGDLYQWGRWTDGHQLRNSTTAQASLLSPNDPTGLNGGSDLFYIGANPTDWWSAGSGTDTWNGDAMSSSNGMDPCIQFGPGWMLPSLEDWAAVIAQEGITNVATGLASNLRLPAAGTRDGQSGTIINSGLYGGYWTSTASDIYAKDVTILDNGINANDDALRSYGMCVRCLNKNLHMGITSPSPSAAPAIHPLPTSGPLRIDARTGTIDRVIICGSDMRQAGTWSVRAASATIDLSALSDGMYWLRSEGTAGTGWQRVIIAH